MLNNPIHNLANESKSGKKRRTKKDKVIKTNAEEPKKKRRRRKNNNISDGDIELITPDIIVGLSSSEFWANFKLGQVIRDTELIKLILKALKWNDNDENMEKLRNTDLGVVLSNSDLLHDEDLIRLIKSYMGHDGNNNSTSEMMDNLNNPNLVTEMEVKVDPSLFLPEEETFDLETDDSRTISVDLNEIIRTEEVELSNIKVLKLNLIFCFSCRCTQRKPRNCYSFIRHLNAPHVQRDS